MTSGSDQAAEPAKSPPPLPSGFGKDFAPLGASDRIMAMDVLRGLALLGILMINIIYFSHPMDDMALRHGLMQSPVDMVAEYLTVVLVEGKFYPLFSLLFGMGFAMQMDRSRAKGLNDTRSYRRRLWLLLGFGLAHGIFLWNGDVLFLYALTGFGLLLFRNRKPKTLIIWACVFTAIQAGAWSLFVGLFWLLQAMPEFAGSIDEIMSGGDQHQLALERAYVTGSYSSAVAYRLHTWVETATSLLLMSGTFVAMMLVGMHPKMRMAMRDPESMRPWLKTCALRCGGIALIINGCSAFLFMIGLREGNMAMAMIHLVILTLGGPLLTLTYVSTILLCAEKLMRSRVAQAIGSAGRMALSNYLFQSLIASTLFYGYGFGLGGALSRLETLLMAVGIFMIQVLISHLWLEKFRFGPAEWLWRSLTYRKPQAMRVARESSNPS